MTDPRRISPDAHSGAEELLESALVLVASGGRAEGAGIYFATERGCRHDRNMRIPLCRVHFSRQAKDTGA